MEVSDYDSCTREDLIACLRASDEQLEQVAKERDEAQRQRDEAQRQRDEAQRQRDALIRALPMCWQQMIACGEATPIDAQTAQSFADSIAKEIGGKG